MKVKKFMTSIPVPYYVSDMTVCIRLKIIIYRGAYSSLTYDPTFIISRGPCLPYFQYCILNSFIGLITPRYLNLFYLESIGEKERKKKGVQQRTLDGPCMQNYNTLYI